MKNIKNWLTRNDFKFEVIKLNEIEGVQNNAIMVSNDYEGLHATKEVIENYKKISKYINRFQKDFTAEHVGSYTGVLIQPKTLDNTLVQATVKEDKINDLKDSEVAADTESNIKEIKESYNQFVFEINNKLYYIVFSGDGSLSISDYLGEEKINKHNVKINTENERKYNFDKSIYKNILHDEIYRMNFIIKFLEENKIEEVENMKELNFRELEIIEDTPINCKYCKDFTKEELILLAKENNINIDKSVSKEYIFISIYNWIVEGDETQDNFYHVNTNLGEFIGTTDEEKEIKDLYNAIVNDSDFKNIQEFKTCENKLDVKIDNNWIYSYCELSFDKNIKKLKSMLETKLKEDNKTLEITPAQDPQIEKWNNKLNTIDKINHQINSLKKIINKRKKESPFLNLVPCNGFIISKILQTQGLAVQYNRTDFKKCYYNVKESSLEVLKIAFKDNNDNLCYYDVNLSEQEDTIKEEFKEVEKVDPTPAAEEIILNEDYQIHLKNRYEIIIKFLNDNNIKHEVIQPDTTHLIIKINNISLFLEKGLEEGIPTWGKTSIFKSDLSILDKNLHYLNLEEVITYLKIMINNTSLEVI